MDDRSKITSLEQRLAGSPAVHGPAVADLEMLADLYIQADSYVPALETIDRLLSLPAARGLNPARRAALQVKAAGCRLSRGEAQAGLAQLRETLRDVPAGSEALRALVLLECGKAEMLLGRVAASGRSAAEGLRIADRIGDLALSAKALEGLGTAAYREGDLAQARDLRE